jgi:hypothetical protein
VDAPVPASKTKVTGQHRLAVAAAEADIPAVPRGRVAVGVQGGDGEGPLRTRGRRRGEAGDAQAAGRGCLDRASTPWRLFYLQFLAARFRFCKSSNAAYALRSFAAAVASRRRRVILMPSRVMATKPTTINGMVTTAHKISEKRLASPAARPNITSVR